ncbi:MAG: LpxL/LpxP family Kdo(2)-lipid IV(A) lauroyl/palmitoleoyl acyltransferase [Gammaproteobacteria bacterium]|nr:LpxL/LpxP family Kdo(2)-lipid IV(A) lauroyl/palmitoleoyl acyltransferase [Gammaproteobacteria bacterium]
MKWHSDVAVNNAKPNHGSQPARFPFHHYLAPRHWPTAIALLLLRLMLWLPYRWQLRCGAVLGDLMRHLMRCRRQIAATNLQLAFPHLSPEARQTLLKRHFRHVGQAIFESAMAWWWSDQHLLPLATINGLEHLQQAAASGRAILLISAHFTSFEIGSRFVAASHPFHFAYKVQRKNPLFEAYTRFRRLHYFLQAIPHRDVRALLRTLQQRQSCWYLPDQDFGRKGSCFVPFMGVETATLTATSRLARSSHALVIPFFCLRRPDNSGYSVDILPPLNPFGDGDDAADCRQINACIESYIARDAAQYFWLHRRFRTRPKEGASPYPC